MHVLGDVIVTSLCSYKGVELNVESSEVDVSDAYAEIGGGGLCDVDCGVSWLPTYSGEAFV